MAAVAHERVSRNELTPVHFLWRAAGLFPQRVAVVNGARRITYGDLGDRVRRLAGALAPPS